MLSLGSVRIKLNCRTPSWCPKHCLAVWWGKPLHPHIEIGFRVFNALHCMLSEKHKLVLFFLFQARPALLNPLKLPFNPTLESPSPRQFYAQGLPKISRCPQSFSPKWGVKFLFIFRFTRLESLSHK